MTQSDADWLDEAARYFEKRPTGGEDMAFWANVSNAERCRSIAAALRASSGVEVSTEAGPGFACEWDDGEYTIRWDDDRSLTAFASGKVFAFTSGHIPRSYTIEGLSSPLPIVEVTEEMVERLIEFATDVGRYSPKIVPMGANPPIFDGMQDDTDGAWLNRVGVAKRIRSFFTAALSQNKGE